MVAALVIVRGFDELAAFLPAGTLESFRDDLDLSYAQAGAVLTAIAPGALVGNLAAIAADFVDRRLIVVGGAFGYAASMLTFALGQSFVALLVGGFVLGAASTAMVDAAEVALADVAGSRLRVLLARGNLAAYVGDLLGPALLIGVTAAGMSWRAAFVCVAVVLALYGIALARHPLPPAAGDDAPARASGHVAQVLRDPRVWLLGVLSVLMNPLDETVVAFGIAFLEDERGLSSAVATSVALVMTVGGLVAIAFVSRLEGRDDDRILAVAGAAMAASVLLFVVVPGPLALVPMAMTGAAVAIAWVVMQHRILTVRPGAAGTTKALVSTVDAAGLAMPIAIGAVADRWGIATAMTSFVALASGFALLAWWGIHLSRGQLPYRRADAGGPLERADGD
jgi:predicted MFS family arabinose efflux permease